MPKVIPIILQLYIRIVNIDAVCKSSLEQGTWLHTYPIRHRRLTEYACLLLLLLLLKAIKTLNHMHEMCLKHEKAKKDTWLNILSDEEPHIITIGVGCTMCQQL